MSTAKSTAKEHELTAVDFADILSTTLALAAEAGLSVGVRNVADGDALIIRVTGLAVEDGRIVATPEAEPAEPAS